MIPWSTSFIQDHPDVLTEQHASYNDGLYPGDIFHPDFQNGRSAYFDASICSTTQPAYISSSTSCAGVAAAAGELAKDEKHLAAVMKVGADFIPLVVEHVHTFVQKGTESMYYYYYYYYFGFI